MPAAPVVEASLLEFRNCRTSLFAAGLDPELAVGRSRRTVERKGTKVLVEVIIGTDLRSLGMDSLLRCYYRIVLPAIETNSISRLNHRQRTGPLQVVISCCRCGEYFIAGEVKNV